MYFSKIVCFDLLLMHFKQLFDLLHVLFLDKKTMIKFFLQQTTMMLTRGQITLSENSPVDKEPITSHESVDDNNEKRRKV